MKFSCERCGKKYATAETPAPGRVYKIKCKACGHLIVVKAFAGATQSATTELRPPTAPGIPAVQPAAHEPPPGLTLEVAPPEAAGPPAMAPLPELPEPSGGFELPRPVDGAQAGVPRHPDATQEISVSGLTLAGAAPTPTPPPADGGYVDLFAEPARPEPTAPAPQDDPFLAAARASLPDGYGQSGTAPDPFAPLREELKTPPEGLGGRAAAPPVPKVPVIAKPAPQKSTGPIALIAAGAVVLVGILAFVLIGGKKAPPPPAPAPPPAAQAQAPAPPPQVQTPAPAVEAPPPAPVAAAAAPAPEKRTVSDEERRAREEKRQREREAKDARDREAKEARDREKAAREAKAREDREAREAKARAEREARERERARVAAEREAAERERQRKEAEKVAAAGMADAEGGLTQDQIQKVLSSTRKAFENCIVTSGKSGEVKLDGRRVMLRLNIQNNGAVTYPTLDDVTLNGTELGSCLKSAARLMVFPKFKGDTMHVEVPLVLAGGR